MAFSLVLFRSPLVDNLKGNAEKLDCSIHVLSRAIEQLSQVLERGHGKTLRESFAAMALFHRYRLHNVIMISWGLNATQVAPFIPGGSLADAVKRGCERNLILTGILLKRKRLIRL